MPFKDEREDSLWTRYEDTKDKGGVLLGVTIGIWALNLIDAALAGNSTRRKIDLYFSTCFTGNPQLICGIDIPFGRNVY